MPFGSELSSEGVRFRVFAPAVSTLKLALEENRPGEEPVTMHGMGGGWHELVTTAAAAGTRYRFVLPDGSSVPDPASRFQPVGVHGPSEVIDPAAFSWTDAMWAGVPWEEAVLYELHIGTFTTEGTFRAAIAKLDHLAALGVTAIELMCVCAFAGQRSWGYDGVLFFAPDATYGRPDDLKALVDAAHARGLAVILDVVYNHFGPEGNYLPKLFPQVFSAEHKTAWGPGLNFDGPESKQVREFVIHNALYWIEEFHVDGLRLDASHAMIDTSDYSILNEIAERVHATAAGRRIHLILENERSVPSLLKRSFDGREMAYTAQWNHSSDHLIGLSMAGDCASGDKAAQCEIEELGTAVALGFVTGKAKGSSPPGPLPPPAAFISFIQTHDLVGNRIFGERIHELAPAEAVRAVAAIYLLLPQTPMLFMGEEWAAATPFPFFSDYGGELAESVRRGRHEQLARTGQGTDEELDRAPDPQAESTFRSAKLNWDERMRPEHAERLKWYRRLLEVRRERLVPLLRGPGPIASSYRAPRPGRLEAEWDLAGNVRLKLEANLCRHISRGFQRPAGTLLWLEGAEIDSGTLGPWTVRWILEAHNPPKLLMGRMLRPERAFSHTFNCSGVLAKSCKSV